MKLDLREVLDRTVGSTRVGKNHRVLSILMLEIVVDPILLHQPGSEGEIGFAILNAIFDLVVIAGGAELKIRSAGESGIREHLLDNVFHVLIKKNPTIGAVSQQPEPWPQHQSVLRIVLLSAHLAADPLRVGEDAAEKALLLLVGFKLDRA